MCAGGTCGERRCATSEMPLAQKRAVRSAPGICAANSGANSPQTVETLTPTFSNTRPRMQGHHAAAAARPVPGLALEAAGRQPVALAARGSRPRSLECGADAIAQLLEPGTRALAQIASGRARIIAGRHPCEAFRRYPKRRRLMMRTGSPLAADPRRCSRGHATTSVIGYCATAVRSGRRPWSRGPDGRRRRDADLRTPAQVANALDLCAASESRMARSGERRHGGRSVGAGAICHGRYRTCGRAVVCDNMRSCVTVLARRATLF